MTSLFSAPKMPEAPPPPEPPTPMPTVDNEAVARARKKAIADMQRRSGRSSTILSQGDRLGG